MAIHHIICVRVIRVHEAGFHPNRSNEEDEVVKPAKPSPEPTEAESDIAYKT